MPLYYDERVFEFSTFRQKVLASHQCIALNSSIFLSSQIWLNLLLDDRSPTYRPQNFGKKKETLYILDFVILLFGSLDWVSSFNFHCVPLLTSQGFLDLLDNVLLLGSKLIFLTFGVSYLTSSNNLLVQGICGGLFIDSIVKT